MMTGERIKRRRLPSRHACIACRKRKHRCDGERPECGGCRSRWIACEYPSKESATAEISRTEASKFPSAVPFGDREASNLRPQQSPLSILPPPVGTEGLALPWTTSSNPLDTPGDALPALDLPSSVNNGINHNDDATPNIASSPARPRPRRCPSPQKDSVPSVADNEGSNAVDGLDGFFGDSSTFTFVSKVQCGLSNSNGIHKQSDEQMATDTGESSHSITVNPRHTSKGTYQLPERHLADSLVDGYFDRVHPLYPFLHEGSFRAEYEATWTNLPEVPLRPSWYALLNIVCALGCEFCDAIREDSFAVTATPFVDRCRGIILSHIYRRGNMEIVQTLLLMCHYLQGTLKLNECWNLVGLMIRTAVSLGLQLNPDTLPLPAVEKEVRKRIWWGCFTIDRTLSMKFGRPPALQAADAQIAPFPVAVDDQYILQHATSVSHLRQPLGRPAVIEFFLHTIKLSKVIDDILQQLYAPNVKFYSPETQNPLGSEQSRVLSTVLRLDGDLRAWWNAAPVHLRPQSTAVEGQVFQRQRTVLQIRYLQIRILIQRPLLLMFGRQDIEDEFSRAVAVAGCQSCIHAARQTLQMIIHQYHRGLLNSLWYNLHYVFTSMGVLLHVQTMDRMKQEMLGLRQLRDEGESMKLGMEFLKGASKTSNLAGRYAAVLQRIINSETTGPAKSHQQENSCSATTERNINSNNCNGNITATASPSPPLQRNRTQNGSAKVTTPGPESQALLPEEVSLTQDPINGLEDAFRMGGSESWNLNEWLLGIGLPQNFLSLDDTNGEFLL